MQVPSDAYHRMRSAYARWFWTMPGGVLALLTGIALLAGRRRRVVPGAVATTAGVALLFDAMRERSVYEVARAEYDAEE